MTNINTYLPHLIRFWLHFGLSQMQIEHEYYPTIS